MHLEKSRAKKGHLEKSRPQQKEVKKKSFYCARLKVRAESKGGMGWGKKRKEEKGREEKKAKKEKKKEKKEKNLGRCYWSRRGNLEGKAEEKHLSYGK